MNKTIFIVLVIGLISCKKFSHDTEPLTASNCIACEFAESLEGEYEGTVLSMVSIPFTSSFHYGSTLMKAKLEHVFLNKGTYIDSTIMFMKFTTIFPEWNDTTSRIISFEQLSGEITNIGFEHFTLNPDSIYFHHAPPGKYTPILADYVGYRQ